MYSAILLAALSGVYGVDIPGRMLVGTAFFALLAVLWIKAGAGGALDGGPAPGLRGLPEGIVQVHSLADVTGRAGEAGGAGGLNRRSGRAACW